MRSSIFQRHPKITLAITLLILSLILLMSIEWTANRLFGLGHVVLYEANPIYGYRPVPNQHVARKADCSVKINNLGLRAAENWDSPRTTPRVLFVGDSVTYGGSYIDNAMLFSTQVGQKLPKYQTGNAAVNGWGVHNVVAFIRDKPFLDADVYVLVFPEGDFYRGMTRIGGQPFWTRQPRYALEELWQYGIYRSNLKKTPHLHTYASCDVAKHQIANLAVQQLNDLMCFLKSHQKQVLIYISPSLPQALGQEAPDPIIKKLLTQYNVPATYLVDKLPALESCDKKALYHDVIHLSPYGHTVWAQLIAADVAKLSEGT